MQITSGAMLSEGTVYSEVTQKSPTLALSSPLQHEECGSFYFILFV